MHKINKLAFLIFGDIVRKNKEKYSSTCLSIKQAHIDLPWDIYISTAFLLAIISGIFGLISGVLLIPLFQILFKYYIKIAPAIGFSWMGSYEERAFILIITLFLAVLFAISAYYGTLAYPGLKARTRKSKIDLSLPHAVAYMHALSKGRLSLISIFRSVSQHVNVYGESAEEIAFIVMDSEVHESDIVTAIKNAAARTQSDKFRDFLENIITVAETSGDLETLFGNLVNHYQNSAESEQSLYLETLGVLAEAYITVFVAGPLFLITILIVMGLLGPGTLIMIKLVIYAVIPLSAAAFCSLLSAISIQSDTKMVKIFTVSKSMRHYDDVRIIPSKGDERLVRRFIRSLRWTGLANARKNPLKIFLRDPNKAFYFTLPAALVYFILSIYQRRITVDVLDDSIVISTIILFVPFLLFYEAQTRRIRAIEVSVPVFLRRMAVINDVGMPIAEAIKQISRNGLGVLSAEVRLISKDIAWTNNVVNALTKFEQRVRTIDISRIVVLISKASESTGNIKETLRVAATEAELTEKLRAHKFNILFSYLIIIYISFGVFLLVLYIFATMFLPQIPSGASTGMFSIGAQKDEYAMLFMHASIIQGFFSGIIVGQMMGENIEDGLKHSIIMMSVAYIFFTFFI